MTFFKVSPITTQSRWGEGKGEGKIQIFLVRFYTFVPISNFGFRASNFCFSLIPYPRIDNRIEQVCDKISDQDEDR